MKIQIKPTEGSHQPRFLHNNRHIENISQTRIPPLRHSTGHPRNSGAPEGSQPSQSLLCSLLTGLCTVFFAQTALSSSNYSSSYIADRESIYANDSYHGTSGYNNDTYRISSSASSRTKAMITAPHAVRTVRANGSQKSSEPRTGAMARLLALMDAGEAACFAVTNVYNNPNNPREPNSTPYPDCAFTQEAVSVINSNNIQFSLDLHGAASSHPFAVNLGTAYGANINYRKDIQNLLAEVAADYGWTEANSGLDVDMAFTGGGSTISRKINQQTSIPTVQIEINGEYRLLSGGTVGQFNYMMDFLKDVVDDMDTLLTPIHNSSSDISNRNAIYSNDSSNGTSGYSNNTASITGGTARIRGLVTSGRSVRTVHNGTDYVTHTRTGVMARNLGRLTTSSAGRGANIRYVTNVYNDPNNPRSPDRDTYANCSFSQEIVSAINNNNLNFVMDLRGASAGSNDFAVAIGTNFDSTINGRRDIREKIKEVAAGYGWTEANGKLDYNDSFPATSANDIPRKVHDQTGVPVIQIWINGEYRLMSGGTVAQYNEMMNFLGDLSRELDQLLGGHYYTEATVKWRGGRFSNNDYNGTSGYSNNTNANVGAASTRLKALVLAPRAVRTSDGSSTFTHHRNTGAMARQLGLDGGIGKDRVFAIQNVYNDPNNPRAPQSDPFASCSFTQEAVDRINSNNIKFVLDLRGANASNSYNLAIATYNDANINHDPNIANTIKSVAANYGWTENNGGLNYNSAFNASLVNDVPRKIHNQTGVPVIQVWIRGTHRFLGGGGADEYNEMMDFLEELTRSLDQLL